MVHYKPTYFNFTGNAEHIRQWFVLAGQYFEDHRISMEEWPAIKESMIFHYIPVLEEDGEQLAQSHAIARYIAREFGFAGKTPWEEAQVDSLADQKPLLISQPSPLIRISLLRFLRGDSLTWFDLQIAEFTVIFSSRMPLLYEELPELLKHAEKVHSIPAIKKWREQRPQTDF